MRNKMALIFLSLLLAMVFVPVISHGEFEPLKACGTAGIVAGNISRAKDAALRKAMRNAVEMGLGAFLDSQTRTQNGKLVKERIFSQASGYIDNFTVESDGSIENGSTYRVCILASVKTSSIKNDLRALGILRRQVGNPRFVTLYLPESDKSLPEQSRVVNAASCGISGVFARKGFVVLDPGFANALANKWKKTGNRASVKEALSSLARKHQAELLILFDVQAIKRLELTNKYFAEYKLKVRIRTVEPATADLIATSAVCDTLRISRNQQVGPAEDVSTAEKIERLAERTAETLVEEALRYFDRQVHGGNRLSCRFQHFNQEEIFHIVEVIETMEDVKDKQIRNQSLEAFQVDVHYLGSKSEFQRELFSLLKRKGVEIRYREIRGNQFLIEKNQQ